MLKRYKVGTDVHAAGRSSKADGPIAALTIGTPDGGTNWPGGAYDPETAHRVSRRRQRRASPRSAGRAAARVLRHPLRVGHGRRGRSARCSGPATAGSDADAPSQRASRGRGAAPAPARPRPPRDRAGRRRRIAAAHVEGLPIVKPPYGMLSAINLDRGEIMWQVPHGDTPDNVRNHPALQGHEHSEDRAARRSVGLDGDEDARRHGRSAGDDDARSIRAARCCAPTTRRPARKSARC